jgi:hypothetical protein
MGLNKETAKLPKKRLFSVHPFCQEIVRPPLVLKRAFFIAPDRLAKAPEISKKDVEVNLFHQLNVAGDKPSSMQVVGDRVGSGIFKCQEYVCD